MGGIVRLLFFVSALTLLYGCVSYETSCGTGEFTYEPYPAVLPAGAVQPPTYPIPNDAHCVSPGSTIEIENLEFAYSDLAEIQRLDLAIFHTRYDPNAIGAGGAGVWGRLEDPDYIQITEFSRIGDGPLQATIPSGIAGQPPAAASIRMIYVDDNGDTQVVDLEADRRDDIFDHSLYFVPTYRVYLARSSVSIGFDFLDRTVNGETIPSFDQSFPRGWEEYCRIRYKNFRTFGFPGTVEFREPTAQIRRPNQGYQVTMPATRTGTFEVHYQIVCPENRWPSGQNLFSDWGLLGDFTAGLERGMPAIFSVDQP